MPSPYGRGNPAKTALHFATRIARIRFVANVLEYLGKRPQIGAGVFLADNARVIGDTEIGEQSSIWFGSVLRGDINRVVIGHHTNIQDNSVCHVADEFACVVGNYVTVGHRVILHGCTVSDEVLVGMGAVLMNGVVVGEQSIIGAAALLTEGLQVPPGRWFTVPPRKWSASSGATERAKIKGWAEKYCRVAGNYLGQSVTGRQAYGSDGRLFRRRDARAGRRVAVGRADLDLVAFLGVRGIERPDGDFQDVHGLLDNAGAIRRQGLDGANHVQILVEKQHVDGEPHPERVNAVAAVQEQAFARPNRPRLSNPTMRLSTVLAKWQLSETTVFLVALTKTMTIRSCAGYWPNWSTR